MTELKPINFGVNKYCVPAVMSALTGRSTDECAAVITSINGKQEIKAVNVPDIIKAFKKLRFDIEEISVPARSLFGVLSTLSIKDGNYLILVPKHIVAISVSNRQVQLIDNASREPLEASASARLTQSVDKVFKITEKAQPQFVDSYISTEEIFEGKRVDIWRHNNYVNKDDNTREHLGYFRYKDGAELTMIVSALNDRVLLGLGDEK